MSTNTNASDSIESLLASYGQYLEGEAPVISNIVAQIKGELPAEESNRVMAHIATNPSLFRVYQQQLTIAQNLGFAQPLAAEKDDTPQAEPHKQPQKPSELSWLKPLAMAASVVMVVLVSAHITRQSTPSSMPQDSGFEANLPQTANDSTEPTILVQTKSKPQTHEESIELMQSKGFTNTQASKSRKASVIDKNEPILTTVANTLERVYSLSFRWPILAENVRPLPILDSPASKERQFIAGAYAAIYQSMKRFESEFQIPEQLIKQYQGNNELCDTPFAGEDCVAEFSNGQRIARANMTLFWQCLSEQQNDASRCENSERFIALVSQHQKPLSLEAN